MITSNQTNWIVEAAPKDKGQPLLEDLVMAWARDRATGSPRYIGELTREQTGYACNCDCYSCGLALQAVNAGKSTYKRRPSFRHPPGAAKDDCLILAARAAALELLRNDGILHLPRRRVRGEVQGLSNAYHEAWIEAPAETVRFASFDFCDQVSARITLDDGRQLRVLLQGSIGLSEQVSGELQLLPTIVLTVDDPTIASMPPDELRKRLEIIVEDAQWCSHWDDGRLQQLAAEQAKAEAIAALDWLADSGDLPEGMTNKARRETLLHLKAKEILERERRIFLPPLEVTIEDTLSGGEVVSANKTIRGEIVELSSVVLEQWMGGVRPDVVAKTIATQRWASSSVLIEITVTNSISEERLQRLMKHQRPVLEIDISRMGGVVSEAEFARLIVEERAGKRWLFHPQKAQLQQEAVDDIAHKKRAWRQAMEFHQKVRERQQHEAQIQRTPLQLLVDDFLREIEHHARKRAEFNASGFHLNHMLEAFEKVRKCAEAIAVHGNPEIRETSLYQHEGNVVERLLAISADRGSDDGLETAWAVINQILSKRYQNMSWQTLYLNAIKAYRPALTDAQRERIAEWQQEVEESLSAGERSYHRDPKYDALIAVLFPKMAGGLGSGRGQPGQRETSNYGSPSGSGRAATNSGFLTGTAYEAWKQKHPEAAVNWEESRGHLK
ncbi:MAG: hypothetical protein ABIK25_07360 [Pseudomonadota bacterium]